MNNKLYNRAILTVGAALAVLSGLAQITNAATYTWGPTAAGTYGWNNTTGTGGTPAATWDQSVSDLTLFPGNGGDLSPADNDVANMFSKNRAATNHIIRMNGINAFLSELDIGDSTELTPANMTINNFGGGSITFKKTSGTAILHAIGPNNRTEAITAPITFVTDTKVIVEQAGGTGLTNFLQISGAVTGSGNITLLPLNGTGADSSVPFAGGTGSSVFFYDGDWSGYQGTMTFDSTGTNGTTNGGDRIGLLGGANAQQMTLNLTGPTSGAGKVGIASIQLGALTGAGGFVHPYANSGTPSLTVGYKNNPADSFGGVISGAIVFEKTGTGTQTLSGNNTYTGATTVGGGKLIVNGTNSGNGAFTVASTATLGGTGSLGSSVVTVNGTLSPGASIESLASGAVSLSATSTFSFELDSTTPNGDLLVASDALTIDTASTLSLTDVNPGTAPLGTKLTLVNYSGALSGAFNGYADDSTFTLGSNKWLINYNDISGGGNFSAEQTLANFVTITAVPEPSTFALIGIGLAGLALRRKRREQ